MGVIGMGRIGRAVSKRLAHGFGMKIIYNDITDVEPLDFPAQSMAKDQLYSKADIISLHVPLTSDTRRLINEGTLSKFKDGTFLINTSRGPVVDNIALANALKSGKLGGAALDVFDPEPLPDDHPLMQAPNTLFTPHIGARTHIALERMNDVVDDVIRVLQDQPPQYSY
jgi:phosphoglycerate dehydrogenase-like enzyme